MQPAPCSASCITQWTPAVPTYTMLELTQLFLWSIWIFMHIYSPFKQQNACHPLFVCVLRWCGQMGLGDVDYATPKNTPLVSFHVSSLQEEIRVEVLQNNADKKEAAIHIYRFIATAHQRLDIWSELARSEICNMLFVTLI